MDSLNTYCIYADMTLATADTVYIPVPDTGQVTSVQSIIDDALATADEVLTVSNAAGDSMGTITITQSGSAAGDIDTLTPTSNNTVNGGSYLTVATNGGNSVATTARLAIKVLRGAR